MIDVLYLTWNRREFTEFSLEMLMANTDWSLVRNLVIHDDGSDKGQNIPKIIGAAASQCPVNIKIQMLEWEDRLGSPPGVMSWYVEHYGDSDYFAKIDSDIVVPPNWLNDLWGVMQNDPRLELLGMEAGRHGPPGHNGTPFHGYSWENCTHIGGVGLMKTQAFRIRPTLTSTQGRFGFTEWQHEYQPVRGFIKPDLFVSELSRIPFEPWSTYSAQYFERDWERDWPPYHEYWDYWWHWWPEKYRAKAKKGACFV